MLTAEKIKAARKAVRESQDQFGRRFGVDQTTIHRWETQGAPNRGPASMAIERVLAELEGTEADGPVNPSVSKRTTSS